MPTLRSKIKFWRVIASNDITRKYYSLQIKLFILHFITIYLFPSDLYILQVIGTNSCRSGMLIWISLRIFSINKHYLNSRIFNSLKIDIKKRYY